MDAQQAQSVPPLFGIAAARIEPVESGLVNRTFIVTGTDGARHVLQWVNPVFSEEVNGDIEAITQHIAARGMLTPRLLRTSSGSLCAPAARGHWRMLTFIDGLTVHRADTDAVAKEAGRLLGEFHVAVSDFTQPFRHRRPNVHDTARHLACLRETLRRRGDHPRFDAVAPLARQILDAADVLPSLPVLPERVVHGDPKISNFVFDCGTGRALCLVDLDTVARMPAPLELGDALRSWCNLAGEESRLAEFSRERFAAGLEGYACGAPGHLAPDEIRALVPATRIICVELAARFCADALNEDYFAWDPARYPTHSHHSEVRAAGQLDAGFAVARQEAELGHEVARIFSGPPAGRRCGRRRPG